MHVALKLRVCSNKMKIYTSYFAKYKELLENGIFPMSISRITPAFVPARMLGLAPTFEMLKYFKSIKPSQEGKTRDEYVDALIKYIQDYTSEYNRKVLFKWIGKTESLIKEIIQCAQIQGYTPQKFSGGIALLCYENPQTFCHRIIVRTVLNVILNNEHQITEWQNDDNNTFITQ